MEIERLSVAGMHCSGCVDSVSRALRSIGGVKNVNVSLVTGSATVQFDERLTSADKLVQAVERAGFGTSDAEAAGESQGRGCGCS